MPCPIQPSRPFLSFTGAALLISSCTVACGTGTAAREEPVDEVNEWVAPKGPPAGSPVDIHGKLSLDGTQIVDEGGNPIQLKGVSTQWLNYEGSFSSNPDAVVWMRDNWNVTLL